MKTTIATCLAFVGRSLDVKAEFSLYYMKFNGCHYIVKWAWKMKCREKFYKMLLRSIRNVNLIATRYGSDLLLMMVSNSFFWIVL